MKSNTCLILALLACSSAFAQKRHIDIDTTEGTWMSLDVSPDGSRIVFDLLGDIYSIPSTGGDATRLTPLPKQVPGKDAPPDDTPNKGQAFESQPRFSSDGKQIVFISDRHGADGIYIMNADGSGSRQLTSGNDAMTSPVWSPDGRSIAVRMVAIKPYGSGSRTSDITQYPVDGSAPKRITTGKFRLVSGMEFSPSGDAIFFAAQTQGRMQQQIYRLGRPSGKALQITEDFGGSVRPRITPDGKWMAYATYDDGQTNLRMREIATGRVRTVIRGIEANLQVHAGGELDELPGYGFSPDGRSVYLSYGGKIHRISVADGSSQVIPFHVKTTLEVGSSYYLSRKPFEGEMPIRMLHWAQFSPDRKRAVFDGAGKVWIVNGDGGRARRLTSFSEREYSPSISPDGRWVAFVTWSDTRFGHLWKIPIEGGQPVQLTREAGFYVNPNWSSDGSRIVIGVGSGNHLRQLEPYREMSRTLSWLPADGGELHTVTTLSVPESFANMHTQTILDTGGRFNRDGSRILYCFEGVLHSVGLDGAGDKVLLKAAGGVAEQYDVAHMFVLSPDETQVAFTAGNNEVWVMPMPRPGSETTAVNIRTKNFPGMLRVSGVGGYFPNWIGNNEVSWTFAGKLFHQRLGEKPITSIVNLKLPVPTASGVLAFRGARLITMKGQEVIENGTVIIRNNRIAEIGAGNRVQVPAGAKVVEVRGKTIVPGFMDIHDHLLMGSTIKNWPEQESGIATAFAYGVTTIREVAAPNISSFYLSELINTGQMIGPRTYNTGQHLWPTLGDLRTLDDALATIQLQKDLGAVMVKEYAHPLRRQRQLFGEAARKLGIMNTAEGRGEYKHNLTIILDGYPGTEHPLMYSQLYGDVAQLMAKTGIFNAPTIGESVGGSLRWYRKIDVDRDPRQRHFLHHWRTEHLYRRILGAKTDPEFDTAYQSGIDSVKRLIGAGVNVGVGSHDEETPTGLGTHWEMWSYVEGGVSPHDALRAGTLTSAQALGMGQDLGSLEKGKLADLVVLDANPLDNIHSTTKISLVMRNGLLYDGNTLDEIWPQHRKFPPMWVEDK